MIPDRNHPIAYFSAEFAIDSSLPTYAGGLGILAGDVMNTAARMHIPMVGIGVLYKGKSFIQHIVGDGDEQKWDSEFDHDTSFLHPVIGSDGTQVRITVPSPDGDIVVKAYQCILSPESSLYFLSTDVDGNSPEWISDMDTLYRGDAHSQIRQQILLGIGGVRLLSALGITPSMYHINEGRPSFAVFELAKQYKEQHNCSFKDALHLTKEQIIYTNHTTVIAGNPTYEKETIAWWLKPIADGLQTSSDELMESGMKDGLFSITDFAIKHARMHTSVSQIHKKTLEEQYPDIDWVSITNGIDLFRWQDSDFRRLELSDNDIWNVHMTKKRELAKTVEQRTGVSYDPKRLVITWARRLAEYKQPKLIFSDILRLKKIVTSVDRPIQFLFAGNSHAEDNAAEFIVEELVTLFSRELSGYALFIPNFNIALANHLTSGSDVWLNTPAGNLEACGTSGMKAMSNGVLNCTILDGWTLEIDWSGVGWTMGTKDTATQFYDLLEHEISRLYYDQDETGMSKRWVTMMKKSIEHSQMFSAERMVGEYVEKLYQIV
jgi:starch phosphorylase